MKALEEIFNITFSDFVIVVVFATQLAKTYIHINPRNFRTAKFQRAYDSAITTYASSRILWTCTFFPYVKLLRSYVQISAPMGRTL